MRSSELVMKYCAQGMTFLFSFLVTANGLAGQDFNYSEDWAVVSAPPPPGPYRSVNLDPRVPGQGAVPSIIMDVPATAPAGDIVQGGGMPGPAAGRVVAPGGGALEPLQPPPGGKQVMPPPVPGHYTHRPQYPRHFPGYQQGGPAYGRGMQPQPPGYYGGGVYRQQRVPPPDVYDAMQGQR